MPGFRKQETTLIVLRDADEIEAAVRAELEHAGAEERPGLERALAIITDAAAVTDAELRARWVRQRLDAAGVPGPAGSVTAIKALRESAPGLSLLSAVQPAKAADSVNPQDLADPAVPGRRGR